jgi:hypothetical protein
MNKKLFFSTALVTTLLFAGCHNGQTNTPRAIKMQGQSGKMDRYSDYGHYAICNDPSHPTPWRGSLWRDKERAMQDAHDHNAANPGHNAIVESAN